MIEVGIMIEGQNGLNWSRWTRIARAVEDLGFVGLFRSDHYTNANPPDKDSLELWISLAWLASHTEKIEFGPLVTPFSFRHPTMTTRMGSAVDDLSGGRLILGLGAGWLEREHRNYGWELLDISQRFGRFEEGVQIVSHLLNSPEPLNFNGAFYQLHEAVLLPRPTRPGGPPILIGGNGPKRTLQIAASYGQEWNAVYISAEKFMQLNSHLDVLLQQVGRKPDSMRRSLMTGLVYAQNQAELENKVKTRTGGRLTTEELRQRGLLMGSGNQILDQLGVLAESGVQRVMLQWLDLDDLDGLEKLANELLHQLN